MMQKHRENIYEDYMIVIWCICRLRHLVERGLFSIFFTLIFIQTQRLPVDWYAVGFPATVALKEICINFPTIDL